MIREAKRERYRDAAIEFVDEVLEALSLEAAVLAGGSGGGLWALWYALAHPERVRRLLLLTGAPLLPGTRVPAPLWVMSTPVVGDLMTRMVKPNAKMVVRFMSSMGEKDTIVRFVSRASGGTLGVVTCRLLCGLARIRPAPVRCPPWRSGSTEVRPKP